jgi:soluble lytic murein transglycosylase-like protein
MTKQAGPMKQKLKLATQIAFVTGCVGFTASCSTTSAPVYSAVPEQKPSAEEIAMLTTLQQTDTSGLATAEMADDGFKPVDLATDKSVAMAYAIPAEKPANGAAQALQQQTVEVASADPSAVREAMAVTTTATKTRSIKTEEIPDDFGQPDISAATALAETKPDAKAQEPFISSTKNTNLNQLISKYAALYDVPEHLVHHVVRRESNYNPSAVHRGNWGLMQIRYNTARGMGYNGAPQGLLDAETNLKYAVKYLRGAYIVADKDHQRADWLYRTGYYYEAKKKNLLDKLDLK